MSLNIYFKLNVILLHGLTFFLVSLFKLSSTLTLTLYLKAFICEMIAIVTYFEFFFLSN